ncbi:MULTISPECIES: LysR family transcriptional regulator [unclassified Ruegeria]|uniref:LysR family transcriptional regulator n=1 Tax=unclassified Ruegeria TaxID=2625375 RepID=UPI001490CC01|nr:MULTISPECIES: LysR family transcriptional regulator [unclassified Ruegeria]NOD89675.1 LysR family transcriptional regulator [Ruegeria sp. HKCCD4318]NOE13998.1 LysR family transcriptional regulator [Ruegeria sp. HKCCD4318-2]NOG08065.1 LysR family transcriptional regulator [Ruegeria sp. HKCCD4315]
MLYISLRQYEYVCAVGRHGSLSAAAQYLNVSQPALSTALTRVEEHLGHPLFIRRRGAAMALTPQGRRFIEQAEALLNAAARIETSESPMPGMTQFTLGCFTDLAPFLLAPALHHLRVAFPNVAISYVAASFEGLLNGLIDGQIDIAITYDLTMDAGFTRTKLFDSRPKALMPPDHPLASTDGVALTDIAAHPLILSTEGLSAQHILGLFRRMGLRPTVAHRAASLEIQRSLAAHGEGIGISYASPPSPVSYDNRRLVGVPITDPDAAESVVMARHGTGPADPTVNQAERVLKEGLKQV